MVAEVINYALNQVVGVFKSTFGDVGDNIRDGFLNGVNLLVSGGASIGQRLVAGFSTFYDEHPFIVLGLGAVLVLTVGIWAPALIRMVIRLPKGAAHVVRAPLALLGLSR